MRRVSAVNIKVSNMNAWQSDKATKCSGLVLDFYRSDYFKKKILSLDRDKLRGESRGSIVWKLDNVNLYAHFMMAKEETSDDIDYEIDLIVSRYYSWRKVIGYIIPMKPTIYVNSKFFDSMSFKKTASNLAHEYGHTMGLRHSGGYLRESLPYFINEWFEYWYKNRDSNNPRQENNAPKYQHNCKRAWWKLWLGKVCYRNIIRS